MGYTEQKYRAVVAPYVANATDGDRELLEAAVWQRWEDINPEAAESEAVRRVLRRIENEKYRADRGRWDNYTALCCGDDYDNEY